MEQSETCYHKHLSSSWIMPPPTIKKAACLIFLIFAILERFSDSRSSPAQKQRAGSKCVFGFCATMQAVSESVERRTVKWEKEDAPCLKVGGQSSADLSLCDILQRAARYMHPDASSSFCALPLLQTRHSSTSLNKLEMFGDGLKSSRYPVFTAEMLFATFSCCEV